MHTKAVNVLATIGIGHGGRSQGLPAGARVLGFNFDTGERCLSIQGFLPT
jgi:hypothetical protein